jgi:hypothetical protein
MLTNEEVRARVAQGAAVLDHVAPTWWQAVDVENLAMWTNKRCMLGQVFGGFAEGLDAVQRFAPMCGEDWGGAVTFGFAVAVTDVDELSSAAVRDIYELLGAAWKVAIADRRAAQDHDCRDWNCGGACLVCRRPLSVEEQQSVMHACT